jgi:hypothetical protein
LNPQLTSWGLQSTIFISYFLSFFLVLFARLLHITYQPEETAPDYITAYRDATRNHFWQRLCSMYDENTEYLKLREYLFSLKKKFAADRKSRIYSTK